jgi:hypothetical protein
MIDVTRTTYSLTRRVTMKNVEYDFAVDNLVAVSAPIGTDPDTLIEEVKAKFIKGIQEGQITFSFENIFDPENGAWEEDWAEYRR